MYIARHVKYPLFLSNFNETWILLADFRKTFKYQTYIKLHENRPVEAELFHADR